MTPAIFVKFGLKPFRHLRIIVIARVAPRAGRSDTPQALACSPSHGLSGWASQTPQSSQSEHFIQRRIPSAACAAPMCGTWITVCSRRWAMESLTARARHQRTRHLRRQSLASFPHCIFLLGPIPLLPPSLKIGLGPLRKKDLPCLFEFAPGFVEGLSRAARAFPIPRAAGANSDHPHMSP